MKKETLIAIGITFLFLFICIKPAIADNLSITKFSDSEVECTECNKLNNLSSIDLNRYEIRIKSIINFISIAFANISDIKENCKQILNIINLGIKEKIFCFIIWLIYDFIFFRLALLLENNPIMTKMLEILFIPFYLPVVFCFDNYWN
jgi:hypothetical protein